jgi:carbamoyltransferase
LSLKGVPVPVPHKKGPEQVPDQGGVDVLARARKMVNKLGPGFKDKVQKLTRFQPLPDYDSADSYGWRLMQAILTKWVSELNVPVMIAVIPVYQYVEKTASYADVRKRFSEFANATGAPVHHVVDDLWPYTADVRRSFRFQSDVHLTPLAHKTIGESIARYLAPLLGEK